MDDKSVFNKDQWKKEAMAVIDDVKPHVRSACISHLEGTDEHIFMNITTAEGDEFCVRLCRNGFSVADTRHESAQVEIKDFFETPYALLDQVSPKYRLSFANQLISRLNALSESGKQGPSN